MIADTLENVTPRTPTPAGRGVSLAPLDLAPLRALYEGAEAPAVVAHVATHPEVLPTLLEAAPRLRSAYGGAVRVRLEPPLFAGGEMFARVLGHGLTVEEADVRTATFDAWWLSADPALDAARRWVEFGVGWTSSPPR